MRYNTNRSATNVLEELGRDLNQLMQRGASSDAFTSDDPRLSMLAFDNRYVIECDLPGVTIENVTLQIEDNVLSISGKRTVAASDDNVKVLFNERSASEFSRRIQLARDVDQSAVDAELQNGVLRITIPKRSEVLPRRIEIKRGQTASSVSTTPCDGEG
jgi:HSP20 family protein